jgi:hypothetical protein
MSLKIAVLSSLTALGAFRAPAPAGRPGPEFRSGRVSGTPSDHRQPYEQRSGVEETRARRRGAAATAKPLKGAPLSLKE